MVILGAATMRFSVSLPNYSLEAYLHEKLQPRHESFEAGLPYPKELILSVKGIFSFINPEPSNSELVNG